MMTAALAAPRLSRIRKRRGRCYELSGLSAIRHPGWVLVHGEVDMADGRTRMGHAWLERDGSVYDSVLDLMMPTAEFYERYRAVEFARWQDARAVGIEARRHRHWGPWAEASPEPPRGAL